MISMLHCNQLQPGDLILSPYNFSCSMDEDFVGKISRYSRRVSIRQLEIRTLQRYLVACRSAERKAKSN